MTPRSTTPVTVGVSLKMYFGHDDALAWFARVAEIASAHPAIDDGSVRLFVVPTYLQILPALETFEGTSVVVGAQDVAAAESGAFTGEVSAAELADVGVRLAEIGHAERRRLFHEDDRVVAAKTARALAHGVAPILCLGENERLDADEAARRTVAQLHRAIAGAPAGPLVIAYEPVWAIGAPEPAPVAHIAAVTRALREAVDAQGIHPDSAVIYGGSAGPGLLTRLGSSVDGLFLGRFAHDPAALRDILDEAGALAAGAHG